MSLRTCFCSPYARTIWRCVSLSIGAFGLLNMVISILTAGFDGNLLWIDLRSIPDFVAIPLIVATCGCLVMFAIKPAMGHRRRYATLALVSTLLLAAVANAITCIRLDHLGHVDLAGWFPLSAVIAVLLGCVLGAIWNSSRWFDAANNELDSRSSTSRWLHRGLQVMVLGAFFVGLPLSQMVWFGQSDYRRSADAVIVFGARAYADGSMSDALEDRVRTACELYEQGLVKRLIFSGGPGDGDISEAQAMRIFAVARGISAEDIMLDQHGVNTRATVDNTTQMFASANISRVLVVSHDYHLPRIKMAYQQHGVEAYTVPALQRYRLRAEPIYMAREVAAWWWYYLHPIRS